jgi:quercetin dioxygenase-like cupin family protein
MKKIILPIAITACALAAQFASAAPPSDVKEIMSKPLTDIPGKEGLVLMVTYPPGAADEIHRHDAHAFVYVLEGSIVMQLRGADPVTLKPGEGFYEARVTFTSSAATRATANRRSSSCSW